MSIEIKQVHKLSQQLVMTPQLQQAIKLLQLSRMELVDLVREELMENPVLEDGVDISGDGVQEQAEASQEREFEGETEVAAPSVENSNSTQEVGEQPSQAVSEIDWENYID